MYQQTDSDKLQGSIRIPIETETEYQRAFNASFDRLPIQHPSVGRVLQGVGYFHRPQDILLCPGFPHLLQCRILALGIVQLLLLCPVLPHLEQVAFFGLLWVAERTGFFPPPIIKFQFSAYFVPLTAFHSKCCSLNRPPFVMSFLISLAGTI